MYFYRDILKKSWQFTKTNRYLWLLGLFAALITGNGGEIELYFRNISSLTDETSFLSPGFWVNGTLANILSSNWQVSWALLVVALVLVVALIWLVITSQVGIIYSVGQFIAKKKLGLKKTIKQSQNFLWSVFCLNLLGKIIVYVGLLVFAIPWLAAYVQSGQTDFMVRYLVISFFILVPLAIVVSFLVKYTAGYIILRKQRLIPALVAAWKLFIRNWLVSLEMAFIIFVLNLVISLGLLALTVVFASPYILSSVITGIIGFSSSGILLFGLISFALLFIIIVFVGSIFSAFQWSAWTFLFVELSEGRGKGAKIVRWFKK